MKASPSYFLSPDKLGGHFVSFSKFRPLFLHAKRNFLPCFIRYDWRTYKDLLMKSDIDQYVVKDEDEWEIIPLDWWCTSYQAVSWSYNAKQDPSDSSAHRRQFQGSLFPELHSRRIRRAIPPNCSRRRARSALEEEDGLNLELVGVKLASEVLLAYERDVGFNFNSFPDLEPHELGWNGFSDLELERDKKDVQAGREKWNDLFEELINGPAYDSFLDSDGSLIGSSSSYGDLDQSASSIDLTFSEGSIDSISIPITPKTSLLSEEPRIQEGSLFENMDYERRDQSISPGKSLNASASSFVPTFCSHLNEEPSQMVPFVQETELPKKLPPPSSFSNFTFPTLNTTSAVKIKKDDQGFFTEVEAEQSTKVNLLPPFLQESTQRTRTRKSRTREIVDRIRSEIAPEEGNALNSIHSSVISSKYASYSPSPIGNESAVLAPRLSVSEDGGDRSSRLSTPSCDDDDGWIDIKQPPASTSLPTDKSQRTRELFRVLTRRRTDSSSSGDMKEIISAEASREAVSPSPSPLPVTPSTANFVSHDGWIESKPISSPPQQKKYKNNTKDAHSRKKPSNNVNRTSMGSSSHQQGSFIVPSTFYSQLSPPSLSPHIVSPQTAAFPYFYPAYTAVGLHTTYPTPYMHMPGGYPIGISATPLGIPYVTPALMPVGGTSTKPPTTTSNLIAPSYPTRTKQSPLW